MAQVRYLEVDCFRSIRHLELWFPEKAPLVLVGENNAGKSNTLAAIQLLLGERWPGTQEPANTDFMDRNPNESIRIFVEFRGPLADRYSHLKWEYNPNAKNAREAVKFCGIDKTTGSEYKYVSNEERDDCICVFVQAERGLKHQLSYTSKWTMLSKLMHRFHAALLQETDILEDLEKQFKETKDLFNKVPDFARFQQTLRSEFADLISNMTYSLEVDFEAYNPANFFHSLRIQAKEGPNPRSFDELGTGEQQILALAFAKAYAKEFHSNVLLAIEEPESHLHPLAQAWLANHLRELARSENIQIVLTTHSPAFIDVSQLDSVAFITKTSTDGTYARQITREQLVQHCIDRGAPEDRTRPDNIFEFYAANTTSTTLEGFFAKKVVLVEGPTEALVLPIYLAATNSDCLKQGISFIPVFGKGNLARYYRLFTAYEIPTFIIFDNDSDDDKNGRKREDALRTLGVVNKPEELLQLDDLYISDQYAIFGVDFETTMRQLFGCLGYDDLEQEAKDFMGCEDSGAQYKPLIARYVAEKLKGKVDLNDPAWQSIKQLGDSIFALNEAPPAN